MYIEEIKVIKRLSLFSPKKTALQSNKYTKHMKIAAVFSIGLNRRYLVQFVCAYQTGRPALKFNLGVLNESSFAVAFLCTHCFRITETTHMPVGVDAA